VELVWVKSWAPLGTLRCRARPIVRSGWYLSRIGGRSGCTL